MEELKIKIDGVSISDILETINRRIEILYDRDHRIGHSYFLEVKSKEDLINVFKDKVIPLLQEYFFSDWGKIRLILGKTFVDEKVKIDFAETDKDNDYSDKEVYRLRKSDEPDAWKFKVILVSKKETDKA